MTAFVFSVSKASSRCGDVVICAATQAAAEVELRIWSVLTGGFAFRFKEKLDSGSEDRERIQGPHAAGSVVIGPDLPAQRKAEVQPRGRGLGAGQAPA